MKPVFESIHQRVYGILLKNKAGHTWMAHGPTVLPALFRKRAEAIAFRKELKTHGISNGRIVKVDVTIRQADETVKAITA